MVLWYMWVSNESPSPDIHFKWPVLSNKVVIYVPCYSLQWQSHESKIGEDEKREIHLVPLGREWRKKEVSWYLLKQKEQLHNIKINILSNRFPSRYTNQQCKSSM